MDLDLMQENATRASDLMKLLGHHHRLMILCELNQGECSVGDLSEKIGINQSPLSQHLARNADKWHGRVAEFTAHDRCRCR